MQIDMPWLELSQRYVKPGHRYMYLISGNLLGLDHREVDAFGERLAEDSRTVTTEELRLLAQGGWQERITSVWLAGMDLRTELRPLIADMLSTDNEPGPAQGCSFALARFATPDDAVILTDYLDSALQVRGFGQDWALGALLHIDDRNRTDNAAGFVAPDGPWDRWTTQVNPVDRQYTNPEAEKARMDELCEFAERYMSRLG
jgi:hypothetical protein